VLTLVELKTKTFKADLSLFFSRTSGKVGEIKFRTWATNRA
jgi:hypothetical protein